MRVKLNGNDFYEVSSPFHSIDSVHHTAHTGLDLAMSIGTPLNSPVDGIVTKVVDYGSNNIGKGIFIETDDHHTVIMGHLSDIKTHVGAKVHEGDFVAYSGSTGHSTGGHLHLGLKSADGTFVNPQSLVNEPSQPTGGFIDSVSNSWDFIQKWRHEGFWHAMYGKSFFQVMQDFFSQLLHDVGVFILGNGDLIFLCPAIILMFMTYIIGRNKYTKYIIPLWFGYFIDTILYYTIK